MAGNVAADMVVHVGSDVQGAISGLNQVDNKVTGMGSKFQIAGGLFLGSGAAMAGGLGFAINTAANFEQAMANIAAVTGASGAELDAYGDLALEIGSKTSFGASEGAQAIEELAKAGIPMADILNGGAMAAANLAEAGGIAMPEAATTMSNAMNMFGIAGKDATGVADIFAQAANASAADVGDLAQALSQGGPQAAAFGMSLDETVGALALFSNYGIKGSDAGTSLKTMLTSLANPSSEAAALMDELGIAAFDAQGNFIGMEALAGELQTGLSGLTQEQQNAALATIFGADAQRVANILFQEGAAGVAAMNEQIANSPKASEMAATRLNTLKGSIESLKGAFETAMIIVGSAFIPAIRGVADVISGAVVGFANLSPNVQKFIGYAVAGVAGVLAFTGALMLVTSSLLPMVGAFMAVLSPVLLVVAALGALYLAYKTNFLGFADGVNAAVSGIIGVLRPFGQLIKGALTGDVHAMAEAFGKIPDALLPLAAVFASVATAARTFFQIMGKEGIGAAFAELPRLLEPVKSALKNFGRETVKQLKDIPWDEMFSGAKKLGKQAQKFFEDIEWGEYLQESLEVLEDTGEWVMEAMGDIGSAVSSWWQGQFGHIDFGGAFRSGLSRIGDLWGMLYPVLAALPGQFHAWFSGFLDSVPWNNLGVKAGEAAANMVSAMSTAIGNGLSALGGFIAENWQTILTVIAGLVLALPAALGYLGSMLLPKAIEFINGFVEGLGTSWPAIGAWLAGLPGRLLGALGSLAGILLDKGWELLQGLWQGLENNWPTISAWLSSIGSKALSVIGNLAMTLLGKGIELITGIYNGIVQNWPLVSSWLGSIGSKALALIGDLAMWLLPKGIELITGIYNGIVQNWPMVSAWLVSIGSKALAAIGPLAMTLLTKGIELITGIYNGAVQNWPMVQAWLTTIGAKALGAIGPLAMTLLTKGIELIQGVYNGIVQNWPMVQAWLGFVGAKALAAIGPLAMTLLAKGIELITGIYNGVVQNWPMVQAWLLNVGAMALAAIGPLAMTLLTKGIELIQGIYNGVIQSWPMVSAWLLSVGALALAAIGPLAITLLAKGIELIQGIYNGAIQSWPMVSAWLLTIGSMALTAIGSLALTLLAKGIELIQGLRKGVVDTWPIVKSWLATVSDIAFAAVGSLAKTLVNRGLEMIQGLREGIEKRWQDAKADLSRIGSAAFTAVGSLLTTLVRRGQELISGLGSGINSAWETVRGGLARTGSAAAGAVGNLSGILVQAGKDLMNGLAAGIDAAWGAVKSKLDWITNQIPDWKGPPSRDKVLLEGSGILIMQGFGNGITRGWEHEARPKLQSITREIGEIFRGGLSSNVAYERGRIILKSFTDGLTSQFAKVRSVIGTFTDEISGSISPWLAPLETDILAPSPGTGRGNVSVERGRLMPDKGSSTVNQYNEINVRVDELEDMVRAGEFVRNLNTTRKLYRGT